MASDIGYALNYTNLYLVDITPDADGPTWARLGQGIQSVDPDDKDTTEDMADYASEGNTETWVNGGSHGYKFKGVRKYGNAAQDYIAGLRFAKGEGRKTNFKHIAPDGGVITGVVTVTDIVAGGGDANSKGGFEAGVHFAETPTFEDGPGDTVPDSLTCAAISVVVGSTVLADVTATPATASDAAVFAVDNTSIATVDDAGNVTGVAAGTCNLSVKSALLPTITATCTITVTAV